MKEKLPIPLELSKLAKNKNKNRNINQSLYQIIQMITNKPDRTMTKNKVIGNFMGANLSLHSEDAPKNTYDFPQLPTDEWDQATGDKKPITQFTPSLLRFHRCYKWLNLAIKRIQQLGYSLVQTNVRHIHIERATVAEPFHTSGNHPVVILSFDGWSEVNGRLSDIRCLFEAIHTFVRQYSSKLDENDLRELHCTPFGRTPSVFLEEEPTLQDMQSVGREMREDAHTTGFTLDWGTATSENDTQEAPELGVSPEGDGEIKEIGTAPEGDGKFAELALVTDTPPETDPTEDEIMALRDDAYTSRLKDQMREEVAKSGERAMIDPPNTSVEKALETPITMGVSDKPFVEIKPV